MGCAAIAVGLFGALAPADAQTRAKTKTHIERSVPIYREEVKTTEKVNAWTLGVAAGLPEGAPLRFATELARVVDDGTELRVLPIVTRGIFENLHDLLYLRGVDAAIVYSDVLEHFKNDPKIANIERRVGYLMHLFPSEVHVFVRPEIKSLQDLAGKPVNFNTRGTAAAYSGPLIFDRLGIKIDAKFDPHPSAMGDMAKSDKYAAVVFVSTKPLDPFVKRKWPDGFKFLPVPLTEKLEEYYLPAELAAADYPGLIPDGQSIQTIAVPAVLAVYNWPTRSERYRRVARLTDYIFERLSRLQTEAGFHPKWKELNLAATVPGWQRSRAMQARLDAVAKDGRLETGSNAGSRAKKERLAHLGATGPHPPGAELFLGTGPPKERGPSCRAPPIRGKNACQIRSARAGAPAGTRNGRYRHGLKTKRAQAERHYLFELMREAHALMRNTMQAGMGRQGHGAAGRPRGARYRHPSHQADKATAEGEKTLLDLLVGLCATSGATSSCVAWFTEAASTGPLPARR